MRLADYNPTQTTPFTTFEKIKSRIWKLVNASIFRLLPYNCRGYRRFLLNLFGAKISKTASIDRKARIDFPWNFTIGEFSSVGENTWIYCLDKIKIGEKTCIGEDVYLITGSHDLNSKSFSLVTKPIIIGDGVWLSTGVKVLAGVKIGDFGVAGAFSSILKNIPPNEVWAGVPAKFIKKRFS